MNTNNGIVFNGQGPMITGTWINPANGDKFTVADSFFQDNQLIVKTTDGRMLDYNFIQNYIKYDKVNSDDFINSKSSNDKKEDIPAEVLNELSLNDNQQNMLEEDSNLIKNLGNLHNNNHIEPVNLAHAQQKSTDEIIIEKALTKKSLPKLKVDINWKDFPINEIKMLIDVMDINPEDITNWYINTLNDIEMIKTNIQKSLKKYVDSQLCPDQNTSETKEKEIKEEAKDSSKKQTTKSKKK